MVLNHCLGVIRISLQKRQVNAARHYHAAMPLVLEYTAGGSQDTRSTAVQGSGNGLHFGSLGTAKADEGPIKIFRACHATRRSPVTSGPPGPLPLASPGTCVTTTTIAQATGCNLPDNEAGDRVHEETGRPNQVTEEHLQKGLLNGATARMKLRSVSAFRPSPSAR